jgi:putative ABC transport system permease protein
MLHITLSSLRAQWRRLLLTTFAVVLGVAFVVGSFTLSDSLGRSIDRAISDGYGSVDLQVQPDTTTVGPDQNAGAGLSASTVERVADVDGVAAVEASISGEAQIVTDGAPSSAATITVLTSYPQVESLSTTTLVSGNRPRAPGEVVVDESTAERRGIEVGDAITVATATGVTDLRVVGTAEQTASVGAELVYATTPDVQRLTGKVGRVDTVAVDVADGASVDRVRESVAAVSGCPPVM